MGDRGGIVVGWLVKLVLVLVVLGTIGFDLVSLGTARFAAEDHAQDAVRAASTSYRADKDLQKAYNAAVTEVAQHGDTIEPSTFTVAPDGRITLTLRRTAATLLVEKVAPLRGLAEVDVTVTARPSA